jgi:hypothetical protein
MNLFHSPWLQTPRSDSFSFGNRSSDRRPASYRRARTVAGSLQKSHALSERAARSHADTGARSDEQA